MSHEPSNHGGRAIRIEGGPFVHELRDRLHALLARAGGYQRRTVRDRRAELCARALDDVGFAAIVRCLEGQGAALEDLLLAVFEHAHVDLAVIKAGELRLG